MSALFPYDWQNYLQGAMVFLRGLGLFMLVPVFSHRSIPRVVKVLLPVAISFAIYPVVRPYLEPVPQTASGLWVMVLRETIIGFAMGFVAYLTFEAIHLAAQFVGYQMGFGFAGLVDPQTQSQVSVLVPLHGWLALMIFLVSDMHHEVLALFVRSFETTHNLSQIFMQQSAFMTLILALVGKLFMLSVQIAAPMCLLVILCNLAIGILSRMLPQMNIVLFSFPITIVLGISALYVVAPDLISYLDGLLGEISVDMMGILKTM